MRRALFLAGLICLGVATFALAQGPGERPIVNKEATAKFGPAPNLPDCSQSLVESGDPSKGPSVLLVKLSPACAVPWHWHTPTEHVMVVTGILQLQAKGEKPAALGRGDFALMPARHVHQAKCQSSTACEFFIHSDGAFDIHYVNAAGQEIPADEALKGTQKAPPPKPPAAKKKSG